MNGEIATASHYEISVMHYEITPVHYEITVIHYEQMKRDID